MFGVGMGNDLSVATILNTHKSVASAVGVFEMGRWGKRTSQFTPIFYFAIG